MNKSILDQWADIMECDIAALQAIADNEPDSRLHPFLNAKVPPLVERGWLQVYGCSDGDYVVVTPKGRRFLDGAQKTNPAPIMTLDDRQGQ